MSALGQFANGPIQFGPGGAIEARGTIDTPSPSATGTTTPTPAASATGGGVMPTDNQPVTETNNPPPAPSLGTQPDGSASSTRSDPFDAAINTMTSDNGRFQMPKQFNQSHWNADATSNLPWQGFGADFSHGISGGTRTFAEGGEVDDAGDYSDGVEGQGAGSATVDPMQMIKQAASFGRKKFGLPSNFTTGQDDQSQTMGFDDGGIIPDQAAQGDDQQGGVTAGGNTPDPRKALAYLTGDGAVSPEIAGALEKHVDPSGQMDQSSRTMAAIQAAPDDESKFGMMQHYRTKFNAYSGGARAALDQGNLGQAAAHATQAFANVPTGANVKFAPAQGGIAVAVQGARQFMGAGMMGKAPLKAGDDAWNKFHGGAAQSLADGGEVDDEDAPTDATGNDSGLDSGVIPDTAGSAAADADQPEATSAQDTGSALPTILTPDQFKKLLSAGYDKPVDDGFDGLMKSVMNMLGPSPAEGASLPQPGAQHPADQTSGQGGVTTVGKSDKAPSQISPALQKQMDTPLPSQRPAPAEAAPAKDARDPKYQQTLERAQKTAAQIFPWASQEAQRSEYVQRQMSRYADSENKIDQIGATGHEGLGALREANKLQIARENNTARGERQANSAHSKEDIARLNNLYRTMNDASRNQVRMLGQQLAADPTLAKDPNKAMARVQQLSTQLHIDPQDTMALIRNGGQPPQAPAQAPAPAAGGAKPTVVVFPSGPHAGKPMIRQPDGTYTLAPGR